MSETRLLSGSGIRKARKIHHNLAPADLVERSLKAGTGRLVDTGSLRVATGKYTGRSPQDKFVAEDPEYRDTIWWGDVNRPISPQAFDRLHRRVCDFLEEREIYIFDGFAGADPRYRLPIRVINQMAWHNLFAHQLFIRPGAEELAGHEPQFTVISAPDVLADPSQDGTRSETFVLLSFARRLVVIGGTQYAGEIKKSIFTVMNLLMPRRDVVPMHCSANLGPDGDTAIFFGLSGTGKTTLSADPGRRLIGDDEHGWSESGIFNFEGGCYAKCIRLSREKEPQIWDAIRFGSVVENVMFDESTRVIDFDSSQLTENTRVAYPVDFIPGAVREGVGGHPRTVIFLTADAFGVLPPISRLDREQTMYHFISGYTSKLAGTERGITSPEATFSACFGAPFLPLHPGRYAEMLANRIQQHDASVFLVNTGWTGGAYGEGQRIDLPRTRAMVNAALRGRLDDVEYVEHPIFKLRVPRTCPEVPAGILDPRNTWLDPETYDQAARELSRRFVENAQALAGVDEKILAAGPVGT